MHIDCFTHPAPEILPFLWLGSEAAEQAGLSRLCRKEACPACRTLAEKRNHTAALSATRPGLSAAECKSKAGARAQPAAPAARALVRPVTCTVTHCSEGVKAHHAAAQAGTSADGEPVTATECAPAPALEFAPAMMADGAPIVAADGALALALDFARVVIGVSLPAQPIVDSAIATAATAYGTMNAKSMAVSRDHPPRSPGG